MPLYTAGRRGSLLSFLAAITLSVTSCAAQASTSAPAVPAATSTTITEQGDDGVFTIVAAGDIANSPLDGQGTAELIAGIGPDAVLTLGDNAYEDGSISNYTDNYDPTWGAFKSITKPVPGNHEYRTDGAAGYFEYFRDQVAGQPYYAWDAGSWRMYALNCEIDCSGGSEQVRWLTEDLAAHPGRPVLAYMHEPLFSCSTGHQPSSQQIMRIWDALRQSHGQILLSGHNHDYERFSLLTADGEPSDDGLRQFVVGTGGNRLYRVEEPCPGREAADDQFRGVLKLELGPDSYSWEFVIVGGEVVDSGTQGVGPLS